MAELITAVSLILTNTTDGISGKFNLSTSSKDDAESSFFTVYLQIFCSCIIFAIIICGLVGNAIVIFYLYFILKKNPITTYVLNLAAADTCVLICAVVFFSFVGNEHFNDISMTLFFYTHITSGYLLTAISVEKCLSVLFPIWYRCRRLEHLSEIVCALIWAMFSLLFGIDFFLIQSDLTIYVISTINSVFCSPVVIICTAILFIKVCCSLHQRSRGRFYTALLLTLLFFLIFAVPLSAMITLGNFVIKIKKEMALLGGACAILNSSVNPFIYFLIGRGKKQRPREPLKVVLERVFSDKADCREDQSSPATTVSMMMIP